jgi:hypothetical protein
LDCFFEAALLLRQRRSNIYGDGGKGLGQAYFGRPQQQPSQGQMHGQHHAQDFQNLNIWGGLARRKRQLHVEYR